MSNKLPTKLGQICVLPGSNPDENDEVYIIIGKDIPSVENEIVNVVPLKELQRNIKDPSQAKVLPVELGNLEVIAEDLEQYIASWNGTGK